MNIDRKSAIHEVRIPIIEGIETSQNSGQNGRSSEALRTYIHTYIHTLLLAPQRGFSGTVIILHYL